MIGLAENVIVLKVGRVKGVRRSPVRLQRWQGSADIVHDVRSAI